MLEAAVTACIFFFGSLATNIFFYGKLTQRVSTLEDARDRHETMHQAIEEDQNRQWEEIGSLGKSVAHLEGKVNGRAHGASH